MNNTLNYEYPDQNFDILQKLNAVPGDRLRVRDLVIGFAVLAGAAVLIKR